MLDSIPFDLIAKTISFLPLKQILSISSTSHLFNKSCSTALTQIGKVSLFLCDDSDEQDADFFAHVHHCDNQSYISILWNKVKDNKCVLRVLRKIWRNVHCFGAHHHDICSVMNHLQINTNKLQNIKLLSQRNHFNLNCISYLSNLQWIHIEYSDKNVWNTLNKECRNLIGISFVFDSSHKYNDTNNTENTLVSSNIYTLSIYLDGDTIKHSDIDTINEILSSTQNLKYLQIGGSNTISDLDHNNTIIKVPSSLMALKAGFVPLLGITFDVSNCINLQFIDVELIFLTENIDLYRSHHEPLTKLLLSFLEINHNSEFTKVIGVKLDYENGTVNVPKQEKLDAIAQFKSIMNEKSDILNVFRNEAISELQIVSTNFCDESDLVEVWSHQLFQISKDNILREPNVKQFLYNLFDDILSDINDESKTQNYIRNLIELSLF